MQTHYGRPYGRLTYLTRMISLAKYIKWTIVYLMSIIISKCKRKNRSVKRMLSDKNMEIYKDTLRPSVRTSYVPYPNDTFSLI